MEVKITRISRKDTDKNGIKLTSKKDGKPYWKIGIQTDKTGDEWLSGFANNTGDPRYNMQEGGTYHLAIDEKTVDGKVYKNFRMLSPEETELEELRAFKAAQTNNVAQAKPESFEPTNELEAETDDKF